jgi:hypothetical protein
VQTTYADGIENMTLIDGIICIGLVNLISIDKDKDPDIQPGGDFALSLPALVRTHDRLTKRIDKMIMKGILTKNIPSSN